MSKQLVRRVSSYVLLALALGLGGCANPATVQGMTVKTAELSPAAPEVASSLEIQDVTGGKETNAMWHSEVSNTDFKTALVASMKTAGLLSEANAARFKVRVTLLKLDQPFMAIDMKVIATVRYVVVDAKSGAEILNEVVTTPFTAHLGDAVVGTTRLRLANEGAARKNIAGFIAQVNATKLGAGTGTGTEKTASR